MKIFGAGGIMDYTAGEAKNADGVMKVEEKADYAYAIGAGSAVLDDVEIYVDVDLDDDEAFDAELDRLEGILIERGIIEPPIGGENDDPGPENVKTPEELYKMLEDGLADIEAGLVCSIEEAERRSRQNTLDELRQMVKDAIL